MKPSDVMQHVIAEGIKPVVNCHVEVDSTNNAVKELVLKDAREGLVVIADTQTGGKGRHDREWHSPSGGLYLSIVLKPRLSVEETPLMGLLAGVAVASAIEQISPLEVKLKWPNDIMIKEKKLGGILSELISVGSDILGVIIGIGINQNVNMSDLPKDVRRRGTSMLQEMNGATSRPKLAATIINEIDRLLTIVEIQNSFSAILDDWRSRTSTLGRWIFVDDGTSKYEGAAVEIENDGSLVIETGERGVIRVKIGDVYHLDY
jgi:BirA family biotin operon repressor/biotin-[acetyl-CoA-carboxylase] ligase